MKDNIRRTREHPATALHGGGGERIPADRETRYRNYDVNRENKG